MDQRTSPETIRAEELAELIVDDPSEQRFDVSRRIFHDPEIFEMEMERIFESNWVYLCHESQIPNPHDYFNAWAGRQPVLVTRDADGGVRAVINACSHRGAMLTTLKRGNQSTFMCPYHGWVYDSTGKCVDVNEHASGSYPEYFDKLNHDLHSLGQVKTYRGFVFGSVNPDVEPLETWLGGSKSFIDMFADQSPQGLEVLKGGFNYTCDSNWKLQLENPDGYHFFPVHTGYISLGKKRQDDEEDKLKTVDVSRMQTMPNGAYDLGRGHAAVWTEMPNGDERPLAFQRERLEKEFGKQRASWMVDCVRAQLLFPNLWLMDQSSTTIRVMHPISVDKTRVEVYCVAPIGEPKEARMLRLRQFEDFLGPAGLATPDDQVVMEACQRGFAGRSVPWQQGYARGGAAHIMGGSPEAKAMGLEARASGDINGDLVAHPAYRYWREVMSR